MSVGDQIRKGREALKWSKQRLADELGVSRAAISQWEKRAPKLKDEHIIELARLLSMPRSAFTRFGSGTVAPASEDRRMILHLRWDDLDKLAEGGAVRRQALKKPQYIDVPMDIPAAAVALTIRDESMEPEFRAGEEIIIDPKLKPESDKDYVLARLASGEHLFRRYRARSATAYDLVPDNPEWETVSVTSRAPATILGTLIEHRKRRRP